MLIAQFQSRREAERTLRSLAIELGATYLPALDVFRFDVSGLVPPREMRIVRSETRNGWWGIVSDASNNKEHVS